MPGVSKQTAPEAACCGSQQPPPVELPSPDSKQHWYATYTSSRREKRVARILQERGIESLLPLYEVARRGDKGRRQVHFLPLFPGYVFAHIALRNRRQVLQVPGVVRLVSFNSQPAAIDDAEIEAIRNALTRGLHAEPYPYAKVSHQVEILSGPLRGLRGKVLRKNNSFRVVLSVELLHRSVVVDVDAIDLVPRSLGAAA